MKKNIRQIKQELRNFAPVRRSISVHKNIPTPTRKKFRDVLYPFCDSVSNFFVWVDDCDDGSGADKLGINIEGDADGVNAEFIANQIFNAISRKFSFTDRQIEKHVRGNHFFIHIPRRRDVISEEEDRRYRNTHQYNSWEKW